jgi:hypothetical protein
MKGKKTGGRTKGTPNKNSSQLVQLIAERYPNYHPVLALVEIANTATEVAIQVQANKEVAKYVCPQLKSIEIKEDRDEVTKIVVVRGD